MAGPPDNETFALGATWDPRATVRPTTETDGDEVPDASLGWRAQGAYDLGELLGEGGMGRVLLAVQRSLDRPVAIKQLRAAVADAPRARRRLVREGWVTGSLEHPNVVPVYDLGRDEHDRPYLVLKRIEGTPWTELIGDDRAVRERFDVRDALEWHLRVLLQLCNAVSFAHSRGVIHRDLKPDNVMIGAYGEVYLVDWGLALSLEEARARLPRASTQSRFAGTPAYLAPEQLGDSELSLGMHTDVYLLGGLLYEVLHGRPPHGGGSLDAVLEAARVSSPPIDDEVPAALAALLRRCLAVDPDDRPATAEDVRREVSRYLDARHGDRLAEQAWTRLAELEALLEEPEAPGQRIRDLLGACRFGFSQALDVDPGNRRAKEGLVRALTGVARHALDREDLGAAALLLDELDESPRQLVEALGEARRERDELARRRAALERDLDPTVGVRSRLILLGAIGLGWTATSLPVFWPLGTEPTPARLWVMPALMLIFGLVLMGVAWRSLARTAVSRVLRALLVVAPLSQALFVAVGLALGLPPGRTLVVALAGWSGMAMMGAAWYGLAVAPAILIYTTAALWTAQHPEWASAAMSLVGLVFALNIAAYRVPDLLAARRRHLEETS